MTKPWNGLPDQPERSGWHWVNWDGYELPVLWKANAKAYITAAGPKVLETVICEEWKYICPCPDPSELAQMRKDERERAIAVVSKQKMKVDLGKNQAAFNMGIHTAIAAIRALTDKEGKKS